MPRKISQKSSGVSDTGSTNLKKTIEEKVKSELISATRKQWIYALPDDQREDLESVRKSFHEGAYANSTASQVIRAIKQALIANGVKPVSDGVMRKWLNENQ